MKTEIKVTLSSENATLLLGETIGANLQPGMILGLRGGLGAGKTTLTRGVAAGMNLDPRMVTSPTYAIAQTYEGSGITALCHCDLYRLGGEDDFEQTGIDELMEGAVTVVEWPEALPLQLREQEGYHEVIMTMAPASDDGRQVSIVSSSTAWLQMLRAGMAKHFQGDILC
ncbi:tRNA (adenosine(37)-N6)-threonylcarbamoyltransferase complex ATPase subunit type 1 TsaE [Desulfurispira natronophila]|uniref:tRNA threonylcarbamoyladenosine biosynthesis protein TsaE n=1 Tax=Desulfurispira natronophila TaxID=682562 RepID=A0A7W7Y519_9BACT|nr:tRNA (adenosine(37)-N6)-threonylcarbamoyltransferase complex ATPase subunit type 1 TsaE [Desulfurispira natronophila]MBB5022226.1 tRNA threonylcarbamoyl adenosine modification protein YjeE [Desulfurispira natronophila]